MAEKQFNDVGAFELEDAEVCSIETDSQRYPRYVGQLWLGSTWLTVAEARKLRDWLDKVIPNG